MGRYVEIGLLYKLVFPRVFPDWAREELEATCDKELFDYSTLETENFVRLKDDLDVSALIDLQSKVLDLVGNPNWMSRLECPCSTMSELIELVEGQSNVDFYSITLTYIWRGPNDEHIYVHYNYFRIYYNPWKFLPDSGRYYHEITSKASRLIEVALGPNNKYKNLLSVYVD